MPSTATSASPQSAHADTSPAPIDWGTLPRRDLQVADVFLIAERAGVRSALDTLHARVEHDSAVRALGPSQLHHVAHTLGWRALAAAGNDPSIFASCRSGFDSGCYHGVIEAWFATLHHLDAEEVNALCGRIVPAGSAPQLANECAHGIGHGLSGRLGHDLYQALPLCDGLGGSAVRECQDGVFMENAVFGLTRAAGRMPLAASAHVHGAGAATRDTFFVRATDGAYPCNAVEPRFASACWSYQASILYAIHGRAPEKVVAACDRLSDDVLATECYSGAGTQAMAFTRDPQVPISACRSGSPPRLAACIRGVVEYFTAFSWRADDAAAFCRSLREGEKGDCYRALGDEMRRMQGNDSGVATECAKAEASFVATCRKGSAGV